MRWDDFVGTLTGRERLAKNLLRVRLDIAGGTGDGYVPIDPGDESVALYLSIDGDALHARDTDGDALGGWEIADEERSVGHRNYTVRAYDPATREMLIDIADHDHGPAIEWFRKAREGQSVLMAGPRSWYEPAVGATHHVLAGDLAALPAMARILESTDPTVRVTVIAEVLDRGELSYLPEHPNLEVIELVGSGNGVSPTRLSAALAAVDMTDESYCWFAGEAADARAGKKHLRSLGWARHRYDIVGYWRDNAEKWTRLFEERGEKLVRV